MMERKAFREFLRKQASEIKVRRSGNKVYIVEQVQERDRMPPTEYLDFYLFGVGDGPVIIERSAARELRERMETLEEELLRLRKINTALEIALAISILLYIFLYFLPH